MAFDQVNKSEASFTKKNLSRGYLRDRMQTAAGLISSGPALSCPGDCDSIEGGGIIITRCVSQRMYDMQVEVKEVGSIPDIRAAIWSTSSPARAS